MAENKTITLTEKSALALGFLQANEGGYWRRDR